MNEQFVWPFNAIGLILLDFGVIYFLVEELPADDLLIVQAGESIIKVGQTLPLVLLNQHAHHRDQSDNLLDRAVQNILKITCRFYHTATASYTLHSRALLHECLIYTILGLG
jgi:hypothetical protein